MAKMTSIGGQALIEGIMMRGPEKSAMAVRNPEGEIVIEENETKGKNRPKICRVFLRRASRVKTAASVRNPRGSGSTSPERRRTFLPCSCARRASPAGEAGLRSFCRKNSDIENGDIRRPGKAIHSPGLLFFVKTVLYRPQYRAIASLTNAAVPSPPAASILARNRSSAVYICPSPARISSVQV